MSVRFEINYPRLFLNIRIERSTGYWLPSRYGSIVLREGFWAMHLHWAFVIDVLFKG
jgi:hypothetical protein